MNTPFDINIRIDSGIRADQAKDGSTLQAICKIQPNDTFKVKSISGTLVLHTKGMLVEQKVNIDTFNILTDPQSLLRGNIYELPFTFTKKSATETYKGKNVSFLYSLELSIHLHEEDYEKLKRGVFKKVKSLFTGDKSVKHVAYLELNSKEENYYLQDFQGEMKPQLASKVMVGSITIMAILFSLIGYFVIPAATQSSFEPNLVLVIFISLALAGAISVFFSKVLILSFTGPVEMSIDQTETDQLSCKITHEHKGGTPRNPSLYYEIIEKVTDRRGTSTSVHKETIYQSKKQSIKLQDPHTLYTFPFPQKKYLATLRQGDAALYWEMILEVKTEFGFQIKYRGGFEVIKGIQK